MADEMKETPQGEQVIKEAQEGEFFRPFENYEALPFKINNKNHLRKVVKYSIDGREVKLSLTWGPPINYGPHGGTIDQIVALPSDTVHITNTNALQELEERIGTKLFTLGIEYEMKPYYPSREIFSPDYVPPQKDYFPYYANVQLPDGSQADLMKDEPREGSMLEQFPFFISGETNNGLRFSKLVLPETEEALDNFQIRFVPEQGKQTVILSKER